MIDEGSACEGSSSTGYDPAALRPQVSRPPYVHGFSGLLSKPYDLVGDEGFEPPTLRV